MLRPADKEQLEKKGITEQSVKNQIEIFRRGFSYANLAAPATPNDGILVFDTGQENTYIKNHEREAGKLSVMKFVPASGAATRMFKSVFEWVDKLKSGISSEELIKQDENAKNFFEGIRDFAFWDSLARVMSREGHDAYECLNKGEYLILLEFLLEPKGLNYSSLPKGLLRFHNYNGSSRTAFEEHLIESAIYGKDENGIVNIHFTVSPEHIEIFHNLLVTIVNDYENQYNAKYNITFSIQDPSTDTLAVDLENNPFRDTEGNLLFRPGGHGALIHNLNGIDKDIIFIKNIDNVVPDRLKEPTIKYKKMLGGKLLEIQKQVYKYQELIENGGFDDSKCEEAVEFACKSLNFDPALFDTTVNNQKEILAELLFVPIRVCGMVKNQGEPGGGPFWVYDSQKIQSLQIVESSQVNLEDTNQKDIFNKSTHFNPVDIVCSTKNWKGEKYDLKRYIDHDAGFISQKSKDGRALKALELPGLWNGAMAKWITLFVEVPIETFNPVKTINDLLREEHQ